MNTMKTTEKRQLDNILQTLFPNVDWFIDGEISQGASARIYKIKCGQKSLIARFSDTNRPHANLPVEYAALKQAARSEVGPGVYYANIDEGICIMDYLPSQSLPFFQTEHVEKVIGLAKTIARFHNTAALPPSHSVFNLLVNIGGELSNTFIEYDIIKRCCELVHQYQPLLDSVDDIRPSHRDAHAFNLLFDGKQTYLIDWESAGNESLYFDLAVICNNVLFSTPHYFSDFLAAYFGRALTDTEWAKFNLMRLIAFVYYGLILLYLSLACSEERLDLAAIKSLPHYTVYITEQINRGAPDMTGQFLRFGLSMLNAASQLATTPELEHAVTVLTQQKDNTMTQ